MKVEAPEKPIALGETFEAKVKATTTSAAPVKEGRVKYKVARTSQPMQWHPFGMWDWLYGPVMA